MSRAFSSGDLVGVLALVFPASQVSDDRAFQKAGMPPGVGSPTWVQWNYLRSHLALSHVFPSRLS